MDCRFNDSPIKTDLGQIWEFSALFESFRTKFISFGKKNCHYPWVQNLVHTDHEPIWKLRDSGKCLCLIKKVKIHIYSFCIFLEVVFTFLITMLMKKIIENWITLNFPGGPVVKTVFLPKGAWIWSLVPLVGEVPHATWCGKKKHNWITLRLSISKI